MFLASPHGHPEVGVVCVLANESILCLSLFAIVIVCDNVDETGNTSSPNIALRLELLDQWNWTAHRIVTGALQKPRGFHAGGPARSEKGIARRRTFLCSINNLHFPGKGFLFSFAP